MQPNGVHGTIVGEGVQALEMLLRSLSYFDLHLSGIKLSPELTAQQAMCIHQLSALPGIICGITMNHFALVMSMINRCSANWHGDNESLSNHGFHVCFQTGTVHSSGADWTLKPLKPLSLWQTNLFCSATLATCPHRCPHWVVHLVVAEKLFGIPRASLIE